MRQKQHGVASVMVTNTGDREGTETVQLYIRDVSGSVVRPVRELKGFEKITLKPGESVRCRLRSSSLCFAFGGSI